MIRLEGLIYAIADRYSKSKDMKFRQYEYDKYVRFWCLYKYPQHPNKFFIS